MLRDIYMRDLYRWCIMAISYQLGPYLDPDDPKHVCSEPNDKYRVRWQEMPLYALKERIYDLVDDKQLKTITKDLLKKSPAAVYDFLKFCTDELHRLNRLAHPFLKKKNLAVENENDVAGYVQLIDVWQEVEITMKHSGPTDSYKPFTIKLLRFTVNVLLD